jgi:hypothetical protein
LQCLPCDRRKDLNVAHWPKSPPRIVAVGPSRGFKQRNFTEICTSNVKIVGSPEDRMRCKMFWHALAVGEALSTCAPAPEGWPDAFGSRPSGSCVNVFRLSLVGGVPTRRAARPQGDTPPAARIVRSPEAKVGAPTVEGCAPRGLHDRLLDPGDLAELIHQEFDTRYHPCMSGTS